MLRARTTSTGRARAQQAGAQRARTQRASTPSAPNQVASTENTPTQSTPAEGALTQNAPGQNNDVEVVHEQPEQIQPDRAFPDPPKVSYYADVPTQVPVLRYSEGSPQIIFRYARFNVEKLLDKASKLRDGQPCDLPRTVTPTSDSRNWSTTITFKDGVQWLFQVPHPHGPLIQPNYSTTPDRLVMSEVTTLNYLKNVPSVPAPRVHAWR